MKVLLTGFVLYYFHNLNKQLLNITFIFSKLTLFGQANWLKLHQFKRATLDMRNSSDRDHRQDTVGLLTTRMYLTVDFFEQVKIWKHQMAMNSDILVLAIISQLVLSGVGAEQHQAQLIFVLSKYLQSKTIHYLLIVYLCTIKCRLLLTLQSVYYQVVLIYLFILKEKRTILPVAE